MSFKVLDVDLGMNLFKFLSSDIFFIFLIIVFHSLQILLIKFNLLLMQMMIVLYFPVTILLCSSNLVLIEVDFEVRFIEVSKLLRIVLTHLELHWIYWTHKIWIRKLLILNWIWSSYITLWHSRAIRWFVERKTIVYDDVTACRLIYQVYILVVFWSTTTSHHLFFLFSRKNPF
jgi:hypothetical protein